jgi:hypothetical protein
MPPHSGRFIHLKGRNLNNSIGTIATRMKKEQGTTVLERGTEVIGVIRIGNASKADHLQSGGIGILGLKAV